MWRRLCARSIDVIAVSTWLFALSVAHVLFHLQLWSETVAPQPWGTWFLITMTFAVFYAIYEIAFIAMTGSTPGKDLMNVRVVDHLTGGRPSFGQAIRRWLLPGLVQPIPGAWIGGALTLGWGATAYADGERRSVHDRIAGTRVVMKDLPHDNEEVEARRSQFMPRFVDPFQIYRIARNRPDALTRNGQADRDELDRL